MKRRGAAVILNSDCGVNNYLKQAKVEQLVKHSLPDFRLNILFVKGLSGAFSVHLYGSQQVFRLKHASIFFFFFNQWCCDL